MNFSDIENSPSESKRVHRRTRSQRKKREKDSVNTVRERLERVTNKTNPPDLSEGVFTTMYNILALVPCVWDMMDGRVYGSSYIVSTESPSSTFTPKNFGNLFLTLTTT